MRIAFLISTVFLFHFTIHSQAWEPATAPPDFLTDHSFGFSLDGKGYLVAGNEEFSGPSNKFMQYNPHIDAWTILDSFPGVARGYAIGDVWDGKAYFGFGTSADSLLRDLWVFDPDSMKWSALASCPCDARIHPALVAYSGKIFVGLGGGNNGNLKDWWEYDIASDQWSRKTDFPDLKRHHPYQFAAGDYVYSGFGHGERIFKEWYRYDPSLDTWEQVADIPAEGRVAGTQFSYNDKGYVLSGDGDDHLPMEEGEFWEYDPEKNTWVQLPPHPGKSRWAPASFIIDGAVYLFNGTIYFIGTGSVYQAEAYKYDLDPKITYPDIERVVSHLYNSIIYDMEPMSNGRWALAVKDARVPLALGENSLSIVILDSLGEIEKRIAINAFINNERSILGPIWALPDEEILIRYGVGNCDADITDYVLEKFDSTGTSVWHFIINDWSAPESISLAADGNIILYHWSDMYQLNNMLMKVSSLTGEIMWESEEQFDPPSSFLIVPGTEDLVLGDTSGLKYFSQVMIGDSVTYELTDSFPMDLGEGYMNLLGLDDQDVFYGMNTESKEIYRFRKNLIPTQVMILPEWSNRFSFSKDQFAIGLNFPNLEVRIFDTLGQWLHTYEHELEGVSIKDIELTENGLAVSGNYQSGPTADDYPDFLYANGREEGWFKFISSFSAEDSLDLVSLTVMDIEQLEQPVIDSFFSPGPEPGTLYNISGGKFRIQVANSGEEEIHSFSLNTIFNYRSNFWFCSPVSAVHIDFENQAIAPGESIWVDFEGLLAEDQRILPPQFCFWTSGPNNLPDDFPDDDLYCVDNLVSTASPQQAFLHVYPNPADEEIKIIFSTEFADSTWSLIDCFGRIVKKGEKFYGNRIKVSELTDGIYFLVGDLFAEKIIIKH